MVTAYTKSTSRDLYELAMKCQADGEVEDAKGILTSLLGTCYHDASIAQLAKLYLEENSYDLARSTLEKRKDQNHPVYLSQMAYLEELEMNLGKSEKYLEKSMQDKSSQELALYHMVYLKKSLGEIKEATALCKLLLNVPKYQEKAFLELCSLDLEKQDYEALEQKIRTVKQQGISYDFKSQLDIISGIIAIKKGSFSGEKRYIQERFFAKTDDTLYTHLEKHMEGSSKNNYFLKYINLKELVPIVKEKMKLLNPLSQLQCYNYPVLLDSIIGEKNGSPTKALRACCTAGSPNIVTMYPISVSSHFNEEGLLEDQTILKKRKERTKWQ